MQCPRSVKRAAWQRFSPIRGPGDREKGCTWLLRQENTLTCGPERPCRYLLQAGFAFRQRMELFFSGNRRERDEKQLPANVLFWKGISQEKQLFLSVLLTAAVLAPAQIICAPYARIRYIGWKGNGLRRRLKRKRWRNGWTIWIFSSLSIWIKEWIAGNQQIIFGKANLSCTDWSFHYPDFLAAWCLVYAPL